MWFIVNYESLVFLPLPLINAANYRPFVNLKAIYLIVWS